MSTKRDMEVITVYIHDHLDEDAAEAMFSRVVDAARAEGEKVVVSMSTQEVDMEWPVFRSWRE